MKDCEQRGCLLCSRVCSPVNLEGQLKILAKVWLHKNFEKGVLVPSKLDGRVTSLSVSFLPFLLTSDSK